jgi:hypothetical protein
METQNSANNSDDTKPQSFRRGIVIGFIVAIVIVGILLTWKDAAISDWVIAFFTAVMAFTTFLQWDAMREQNIYFVAQNKHMAEQTKTMIAQNEAIKRQIDQVEDEQRAWLAATDAPISELVPSAYDDPTNVDISDFGITIKNTGATPAIITHSMLEYAIDSLFMDTNSRLASLEGRARGLPPRKTIVAAGEEITFRFNDGGGQTKVADKVVGEVRRGGNSFYLLLAVVYLDTFKREHKTLCCYRYSRSTEKMSKNYQDGEIT